MQFRKRKRNKRKESRIKGEYWMEGSINFTYEELARLNRMIGIALMSGKMNEVSGDKISESVHKKISDEICRWNEKNFAGMDRKRNKIKESRIRRGRCNDY